MAVGMLLAGKKSLTTVEFPSWLGFRLATLKFEIYSLPYKIDDSLLKICPLIKCLMKLSETIREIKDG